MASHVGVGEPPQPQPQAPAAVERPAPVPPRTAPLAPPVEHHSAPASTDAEQFFGGRVLLVVGAFVLLLGVAFFIKYAFDNGWIGPAGRVAIGLVAGLAIAALGERVQRTGKTTYAGALTGLGVAIIYLSLWGAGNAFHLVPIAASFIAMAAVAAALIALALRHDSEVMAAFALIGGVITPLLNVTDTPQPFNLLAYLTILNVAFVIVSIDRNWPRIQWFAFVASQFYLATTFLSQTPASLAVVLSFATAFLVIFLVHPLRKSLLGTAMSAYESVLVLVATGAYYFTLHHELFDAHRLWLTGAIVALAAAYSVMGSLARSRDRSVFAAIALALVTGGVAVTFTGNIVAILWAVEGAALIWVGLRLQLTVVRAFGFIALVLGLLDLIDYPPAGGAAFANERFALFVVLAAALVGVRLIYAYGRQAVGEVEGFLFVACEPIGHACAIYAISRDLFDFTGRHELSLTLFWIAYAAVLFAIGAVRRIGFARWEALVLLSLAILKAFVVDMSQVNPLIRIVSFIALGTVTLAVSYAYQRYSAKPPTKEA
jgi:uncharacterized membrane protein